MNYINRPLHWQNRTKSWWPIEMTGVQALERATLEHPTAPGMMRLIEYEYIRHGTLSFMVSFNVSLGGSLSVTSGPTRTEEDYVAHVRLMVGAHPEIKRWHLVVDNLNIHVLTHWCAMSPQSQTST